MAIVYGSSPDEQPADQNPQAARPLPGRACHAGQHLVLQRLEMVPFAEEAGEVGGDGIDQRQLLGFGIRAVEQSEVFSEAGQAERAQAPPQAAVDQFALVLAQHDAGGGAHALGDHAEVAGGEGELALDDEGAGRADRLGFPGAAGIDTVRHGMVHTGAPAD